MGRTFLILGLLGTAGFVASGVLGYGLMREEGLRLHVLLGLFACLLFLFSQSWIVIYLLGTARVVSAWMARSGAGGDGAAGAFGAFGARAVPGPGAAAFWGRRSLRWGLLAVAAVVTTFLMGSASFAGAAPPWLHHASFYVALAIQLQALWVERRLLKESERLVGVLDRDDEA